MVGSLYVLLIGIDRYPVSPLKGCVNDILAVEKFLNINFSGDLKMVKLLDEQATRANVIKAFDCFDEAIEGDLCFFYYCGHGSYIKAPQEFWTETDGFNETLVCYDSRLPGGRDLIDKELAFLLWEKFHKKSFLTPVIITDCCHSGTITRFVEQDEVVARSTEGRLDPVGFKNYYGYSNNDTQTNGYVTTELSPGVVRVAVKELNHIHIAACRDNQTAKELLIEGSIRGAFTVCLLKVLYQFDGSVSYQDLLRRVALYLQNIVRDQNPSLNLNGALPVTTSKTIFLHGLDQKTGNNSKVYYHPKYGWSLDKGILEGVTIGDKVLLPGDVFIEVKNAGPDFSILEQNTVLAGWNKTEIYDAVVVCQANQSLKVKLEVNDEHQILLTDAFSKGGFRYLDLNLEQGELLIRETANGLLELRNKSLELSLFEPFTVGNEAEATTFLGQVETVGSWIHLRDLENRSALVLNQHFSMSLSTDKLNFDSGQPLDLYYQFVNGEWLPQILTISFENKTDKDLWVSSAYLSYNYGINTGQIRKERVSPFAKVNLKAIVSADGDLSDRIPVLLDDTLYEKGYTEITEYLKFFISTEEMDIRPLEQEGLEMVIYRAFGFDPGAKTIQAPAWTTLTSSLRIVRPQPELKTVPGKKTVLPGMNISAHPTLMAKVSVTSSEESFRSADRTAPPFFRNNFLMPYNIPGNHRGEVFDVLELFDVVDPSVITDASPMTIVFSESFADQECVVAFGYDKETDVFYPVGMPGQDSIEIRSLPAPTASDSLSTNRSLTGSVKLYIQKIVSAKLCLKFNYPLLREVKVDEALKVTYSDGPYEKKALKQFFLFIHGIIGDTEDMVKVARSIKNSKGTPIADDPETAILTFDYENLNTSIEQNAKHLKQHLLQAGFAAGGDYELIIVSHSMGGLVSRWFIEQLGGNELVSKLYMFGTPNAGTAWTDVGDFATSLLTYAINGSTVLKPWTVFIAGFIKRIGKGSLISFNQMNPDSDFYRKLNKVTDPGIFYKIIAGNTQAIDPGMARTSGFLSAFFERVKSVVVYGALDLLLFKEPNDIAVSIVSITGVPDMEEWENVPEISIVPSNHMNYFIYLDQL